MRDERKQRLPKGTGRGWEHVHEDSGLWECCKICPCIQFPRAEKAPLAAPIFSFCLWLLFLLVTRSSPHKASTLVWTVMNHEHKALHSSLVFLPLFSQGPVILGK